VAESRFYSKRHDHADTDGLGPIPSWSEGTDTIKAVVPAGKKFTRYEILRDNVFADCRVTKAPESGDTGDVQLKVTWNYALFGKVDYRVRMYCDTSAKPRPQTIVVGTDKWDQRALDLIQQKLPFKLQVTGPDGLVVFNLLNPRAAEVIARTYEPGDVDDISAADSAAGSRELATVAIAAAALTLIAIAGFVTVAFVVQKAIDAGKCVKAKHNIRGPGPIDDLLEFDIHDC
jgi:hypothetical protein